MFQINLLNMLFQEALDLYLLVEKFSKNNKKISNSKKLQLYQLLSNDENMVNEYLEYLKSNPSQRITVINYLQRYLDNNGIQNDKNYNLCKEWIISVDLVKKKEGYLCLFRITNLGFFYRIMNLILLIFSKVSDKRLNEDGERLYDLSGDIFR